MRQDDLDIPITMKLRDGAPRSIVTLVRRMALADPDADAKFIKEELASANIHQISQATVSMTLADMRAILKLLREEGLLHPRFADRCAGIVPDIVPIKRKRAR